jgi:hypothetical protein
MINSGCRLDVGRSMIMEGQVQSLTEENRSRVENESQSANDLPRRSRHAPNAERKLPDRRKNGLRPNLQSSCILIAGPLRVNSIEATARQKIVGNSVTAVRANL